MAAATLTYARDMWADARTLPDAVLTDLLAAAWESCEAYLPAALVADPGYAPEDVERFRIANVLQAREVWGATRRDGDVIGFDAYAVRVRPLSDAVRALLRPRPGTPRVG